MITVRRSLAVLALLTIAACGGPVEEGGLGEVSEPLMSACPSFVDPNAGPIQGIDISQYQTVSDWNKVAASEDFVIMKATQGSTSVDPKFASHRQGAKGTKIAVGYYHYLTFSSSGTAQADNFIKTVGTLEPDELPPMLDVEDSKGAPANTTAENIQIVKDWLTKVEAAFGRKPLIYTGSGFWGGPNFGNPAEFASYDFCWARYSASNSCPQVPDNLVPKIKMWQYRADAFPGIPAGQTDGITGAVDQDVFYGDAAAFQGFIGASPPAYAAKYSTQSYPLAAVGAVDVKIGQTVTGFIEMTNTGTATWKPGAVFLAPIPRDAASPYHAPTWTSPTRVSSVDKDVAPGQVGHFALDLSAQALGDGSLKLGWVAEGITWFADAPKGGGPKDGVAEVKIHVLPADPGTGGAGGGGGATGTAGTAGAPPKAGAGGVAGKAGSGGSVPTAGAGGSQGTAGTAAIAGNAGVGGALLAGSGGATATTQILPAGDDGGGCGCRVAPERSLAPVGGVFAMLALAGLRRATSRSRRRSAPAARA